MMLYLDTSAILKRYKTERGTDVVDRLFESKEDLVTSQYACVEVCATAVRAYTGKVIDGDAYDKTARRVQARLQGSPSRLAR
jgi:predicted nucleic acid-binding protein